MTIPKMLPVKCISEQLIRRANLLPISRLQRHSRPCIHLIQHRKKSHKGSGLDNSIKPVPIERLSRDNDIGAEICGDLHAEDIESVLKKFMAMDGLEKLAVEHGLSETLHKNAVKLFYNYCTGTSTLPTDLHIAISDIIQNAGHVADIFPYFLKFVKTIYPHIECVDDLKKISDLTSPAQWYPLARSTRRKVIFHAGPTNSGKTYHALQRFTEAKSAVYCAPLKLLVAEVYQKCRTEGVPCDLITGEERIYVNGKENPASHLSCSVEMVNTNMKYDVAVIDEIQLVKDVGRGWAWTRALLGIPANEIHLCGEAAAIPLITSLLETVNEKVEIKEYSRLTQLVIENHALLSLSNTQPGDCIVCMSKNDIYSVSRTLDSLGMDVAVIYGSLPPGTKLAQAARFNDPNDPCKVMVATNAIGMGLNLNIRRIIFYSLDTLTVNEKGEKEMDVLTVSAALQIAGRAGRFGRQWNKGYVTTFHPKDLTTLKRLLSSQPEPITKAGLQPTSDQIELYAYHLPKATLSNLIDIFVSLCQVDDSLYFMCNVNDFKFVANLIEQVPLPLRARYIFCCAPLNKTIPFICSTFVKYARQYSMGNAITHKWLSHQLGFPFNVPKNISDLVHLEALFDILDLYLWLSYHFPDSFPDTVRVKESRQVLDGVIQEGVKNLNKLIEASGQDNIGSPTDKSMDSRRYVSKNQNKEMGDGYVEEMPLAKRLIREGLLTSDTLQQLQNEWMNANRNRRQDYRTRSKNRPEEYENFRDNGNRRRK